MWLSYKQACYFNHCCFCIYYFNAGLRQVHAYALLSLYVIFTIFIFAKAYAFPWAVQLGEVLALGFQNQSSEEDVFEKHRRKKYQALRRKSPRV